MKSVSLFRCWCVLLASVAALLCFLAAPAASGACPAVTIGDAENIESGGSEAETLDPTEDEVLLWVSESHLAWDENLPTGDTDPSGVQVILNLPGDRRFLMNIPVGMGEATCVAAHPSGNHALVAVRDLDKPWTGNGEVRLVHFTGVVDSVEVGPAPDSIHVSPDGKFAVVALEAERPVLPDFGEYEDIEGYPEQFEQVSQDLSQTLPGILGSPGLEDLLAEWGLEGASEIVVAAVEQELEDLLADLAAVRGFENLDDFATSLGFANAGELLAAVGALYTEDLIAEALFQAGMIAERPSDDRPGAIQVLALPEDLTAPQVVAEVAAQTMFDRYFADKPDRAAGPNDIEPEFVAIAPDSTYALVTLQEQSAVAVVDLTVVAALLEQAPPPAPQEIGAEALAGMVMLPHGIEDADGELRGARPDGLSFSPDGSFACTANEGKKKGQTTQGLSVLDCRAGPGDIQVLATYSVFDLAPELLEDTGLPEAPVQAPGEPYPEGAQLLPRIDPEDTVIFNAGCQTFCAVVLERFEKSKDIEGYDDWPKERKKKFGSVLFLDVTGALAGLDANPPDAYGRNGWAPQRVARVEVGFGKKAPKKPPRPEVSAWLSRSSSVVVANEKDKGSVSFIPVLLSPSPEHILTLRRVGEVGGLFDVLLTTPSEITGFSFGLALDGVCDSAKVVSLVPGADLPGDPEYFQVTYQEDGVTVGCLLSLGEELSVIGPGADIRIAQLTVCGSVFNQDGCNLVFTDSLGDPAVGVGLVTPLGDFIVPETETVSVPMGGALCFRRADSNQDGVVNLGDPQHMLRYLFLGGGNLCVDAVDANDDGTANVADPVYALNWLFAGGPVPPAPGPFMCGPDPTPDSLTCEFYEAPCP